MPSFLDYSPLSNDSIPFASNGIPDYLTFGSPAQSPVGLPQDTQSTSPPPGFESTTASVSNAPKLASVNQSWWETIKQDSQSALQWTESEIQAGYNGTKNVVGTVYRDVAGGVGTVVGDATAPARQVYWYILLAVVVVAGGIYFIGKGGAVKVHAVV